MATAAAGIPIDGKTVFTSDHALKLEWLPNWIAIIGSGAQVIFRVTTVCRVLQVTS